MPINADSAKAQVRAKLDETFGPIPNGLKPSEIATIDQYRDALAASIAELSLYIKDNATVKAGIALDLNTSKTVAPGSLE